MPVYDYECENCGHKQEIIHFNIKEKVDTKCPKCGKKMKRLFPVDKMTFKLVYDNKRHICSWGNEGYSTSQYYRKDIDWNKGPAGLPGK